MPQPAAPRPPLPPQLVSHATADHTCVLDGLGSISCWGRNRHGQLGEADTSVLRARVAHSNPFVMAAVGTRHTCALDRSGVAWCWGANHAGQLGTGDTVASAAPAPVATERRFARLSAGAMHTCALDPEGRAFCWGDNRWGQLGDATRTPSTRPVAVAGSSAFLRLSAGSRHTCGITGDARVLCWGDNFLGQLGAPRTTPGSLVPIVVAGVDSAALLSAGHGHTCAVARSGAAWCWGQNGIGQLGSGAPPGASLPVRVANTPPLAELRTGYHHTCAIDVEGNGWCWGANTSSEPGDAAISGQLGFDASWTNLPARIALDQLLASIAPGDGHTCALTRTRVVVCWGSNRFGQLGQPGAPRSLEPVRVMRAEADPSALRP